MRDNFTASQKHALAKRCGYICSNPGCLAHTVGPNEDIEKATSIGQAAHITAASEGGPRYNEHLNSTQRSGLENAIWLCSKCATLIDKNEDAFSESLLRQWKHEAEERMKAMQGKPNTAKTTIEEKPILEANIKPAGKQRNPVRISLKNPSYEENGNIIIDEGANPIMIWRITWIYKLVLQNSSPYHAINIKFKQLSEHGFLHLPDFPTPNNIPPFQQKEFGVTYQQIVEDTGINAMKIYDECIPRSLEGIVMSITYKDGKNQHLETRFEIIEGTVRNNLY